MGGHGRVTELSLDGQSSDLEHKQVLKGLHRSTVDRDHLWADGWDTEQGQWLGSVPRGFPSLLCSFYWGAPGPWQALAGSADSNTDRKRGLSLHSAYAQALSAGQSAFWRRMMLLFPPPSSRPPCCPFHRAFSG